MRNQMQVVTVTNAPHGAGGILLRNLVHKLSSGRKGGGHLVHERELQRVRLVSEQHRHSVLRTKI